MRQLQRFSGAAGRLCLAAVLVVAAFAVQAPALAQVADGIVEIEVVDDTGVALPGVSVELKRPDTGFSRAAVSGSTGLAHFAPIVPGEYKAKVSLSGFDTVERSLAVRVGQTIRLKVVIRPKAIQEAVTVVAQIPLVDVYKVDSSTNIVPEQIQALPTANRNFEQLAFLAPGVERERGSFRFITGGPVIGSSGNASQSTILVDGVDFTDPALGLAKTRFSQDAIAEFRVINNRFDSEVGGSSGGALSIITKSGTNDLKGSLFGYYRADALRAKGALELPGSNDTFKRDQYGFTIGGPISKDKTHFFASFEQVDSTNYILFRPGGAYTSLAADVKHPFTQSLVFLGFDHALTESNTLGAKLDYERYREDNFRMGGILDESNGQSLNRDNYSLTLSDVAVISSTKTNEFRALIGSRKYFEPTNSSAMGEWFSLGTTLQTGSSIYGDLLGQGTSWEVRDSFYLHLQGKTGTHDIKAGVGFQRVVDESRIDLYQNGLMLYLTDTRQLPYAYLYGIGSADVTANTNRIAAFVQDEWRPTSNLSVLAGVRYDLDTNGNDPNFTHPLVGSRAVDYRNVQPRFGLSWDVAGNGANVLRGGAGIFSGRYLLVPNFTELQQNGVTGRRLQTRLSIAGFPIDPNNPLNTGYLVPSKDITLIQDSLEAPQSTQVSGGWTTRLADTGIFFDAEGIYAKGRKEIVVRDVNWAGNATPGRINPAYGQINMYTNDGESEYKALVFAMNGNIKGGHLVTASLTLASKKNTSDDFSPDFPNGYPNDPHDMSAEYGSGRSADRYRFVLSGVFRLPWAITLGPTYMYGAGQPWTRRLGYDYNGDGKNSDRPAGVVRNGEDGPPFRELNLRLSKSIGVGSGLNIEVIAECFNVFNTANYDVQSVDTAMYLTGTSGKPPVAAYANPNFGRYSSTLPSREVQLGLRLAF